MSFQSLHTSIDPHQTSEKESPLDQQSSNLSMDGFRINPLATKKLSCNLDIFFNVTHCVTQSMLIVKM